MWRWLFKKGRSQRAILSPHGEGVSQIDQSTDVVNIRTILDKWYEQLKHDDPWPYLTGTTPESLTAGDANLFLLGASLQYQMPAETVWRNVERFGRMAGNTSSLWSWIARQPKSQFVNWFASNGFHRFKNRTGERVYRIATDLSQRYRSDAREIWRGQNTTTIRNRLIQAKLGEQISEMIVGALVETGHSSGSAQIKADMHTKRVLGRLFEGREDFTEQEAILAAERLAPDDPRRMDRGLFTIGRRYCAASPNCTACPLPRWCRYARVHNHG